MKVDIGIGKSERKAIVKGLSRLLADTYTLYLKTHNFHWNVTGPHFNDLHSMFMAQYTEMWAAVDLIAERIRALGEFAPGSYGQFADLTGIKDSATVPKWQEMVKQLIEGHETVVKTCREALPAIQGAGDESSNNLVTGRMEIHEKTAWMLRALLE
jgi:starvation-inducible DNA-binding protein